MNDYAFELMRIALTNNAPNSVEYVTALLMYKYRVTEAEARAAATEAFNKWTNVYYPD